MENELLIYETLLSEIWLTCHPHIIAWSLTDFVVINLRFNNHKVAHMIRPHFCSPMRSSCLLCLVVAYNSTFARPLIPCHTCTLISHSTSVLYKKRGIHQDGSFGRGMATPALCSLLDWSSLAQESLTWLILPRKWMGITAHGCCLPFRDVLLQFIPCVFIQEGPEVVYFSIHPSTNPSIYSFTYRSIYSLFWTLSLLWSLPKCWSHAICGPRELVLH